MARFRADPQGFLDGIRLPAILDEIQHVPEVFAYVRSRIDAAPRRMGRWFLTGSQEAGAGGRRQLWFFRDHEGLEVDFVMPGRGGALRWIEVKATRTPREGMARPMLRIADASAQKGKVGKPEMFLVHESSRALGASTAVAPGVKAMPWLDFVVDVIG